MTCKKSTRLYFSHPGISAERLPDENGKPLRFKVNVGAEVPLGYYDVRLVTKLGSPTHERLPSPICRK